MNTDNIIAGRGVLYQALQVQNGRKIKAAINEFNRNKSTTDQDKLIKDFVEFVCGKTPSEDALKLKTWIEYKIERSKTKNLAEGEAERSATLTLLQKALDKVFNNQFLSADGKVTNRQYKQMEKQDLDGKEILENQLKVLAETKENLKLRIDQKIEYMLNYFAENLIFRQNMNALNSTITDCINETKNNNPHYEANLSITNKNVINLIRFINDCNQEELAKIDFECLEYINNFLVNLGIHDHSDDVAIILNVFKPVQKFFGKIRSLQTKIEAKQEAIKRLEQHFDSVKARKENVEPYAFENSDESIELDESSDNEEVLAEIVVPATEESVEVPVPPPVQPVAIPAPLVFSEELDPELAEAIALSRAAPSDEGLFPEGGIDPELDHAIADSLAAQGQRPDETDEEALIAIATAASLAEHPVVPAIQSEDTSGVEISEADEANIPLGIPDAGPLEDSETIDEPQRADTVAPPLAPQQVMDNEPTPQVPNVQPADKKISKFRKFLNFLATPFIAIGNWFKNLFSRKK